MALKLPADKIKHLKGGALVALMLLAVVLLAAHVGLWAGIAAGSVAIGGGLEMYQRARKEGTPSWPDALASALPGLVLAAAFYVVRP